MCSMAKRCEEVGVIFPASWARVNMAGVLDGPIPFKPGIATELMECMVPMAARNVDIPGGAQETAQIMAEACSMLGPASCAQKIAELKRLLDSKQASNFQRFEVRFFRKKNGFFLPEIPKE